MNTFKGLSTGPTPSLVLVPSQDYWLQSLKSSALILGWQCQSCKRSSASLLTQRHAQRGAELPAGSDATPRPFSLL